MTLRILLVDDSQMTLHLVRAHLVGENHDYVECKQAADALKLLPQGGFDLVLSDVFMPGMDGWELTRAIRCLPLAVRHVPVLLASSKRTFEVRARSLAAGATAFLFKPFIAIELASTIHRVTAGASGVDSQRLGEAGEPSARNRGTGT